MIFLRSAQRGILPATTQNSFSELKKMKRNKFKGPFLARLPLKRKRSPEKPAGADASRIART